MNILMLHLLRHHEIKTRYLQPLQLQKMLTVVAVHFHRCVTRQTAEIRTHHFLVGPIYTLHKM